MVTLEGVNAKIQRAQDEIERLARDIEASCEAQRALFSEELRPDVGDKIWIFRGETPIVPIEYSIRLGEIVYNLRSALDQLVWQLAHANYKAPSHLNEFPIFDDESRFNAAIKRKLKGVSQQSLVEIKEMQPFRENDEWSALKTLHSLCNIDKHRSVIFPYYTSDRFSVANHGDIALPVHFYPSSMGTELKKDAILCSVQVPDANFEITFFVDMKLKDFDGFNQGKYRDRNSDEQQVILILKDCISTVRNVIDCFRTEVQKHPLFGRRPPLSGLVSLEMETGREGLIDSRDDESQRQFFESLGEIVSGLANDSESE